MQPNKDYHNEALLSDEEFLAKLEECNFSDEGQVKKLIEATYTPHHFNKAVAEHHFVANGNYDYFTNFFGTEVWDDGQGQDMFRERYFAPNIGYDFSNFIRTMQICDPTAADECNREYRKLPSGGRGALPPMEMYRWGVQTERQCIANMRHIRDFREWGRRLMEGWKAVDEQLMNMFYMFAAIRLSGHKILLQGQVDNADGGVYPVPSMDPKNPMGMFLHNYMEPLFPSPIDADLIVPLEFQYLEQLARHWSHQGAANAIGENQRGDKIFEFWYPEDWFRQYALQNPDYFQAIKETIPSKLLSGYSLMNKQGEKEILGNWCMRVMPCLPRFTESTEGGLIPIDNFVTEAVEVGERSLFAGRSWMNAPFLMAIMPSPRAGTIIYRPDITTSVEGWPIKPIMGRGGWVIRNEYDKECNYKQNMPYSERDYEIGFRLDDPEAALSIIFRNTIYRTKAANRCNWAPVTSKAPVQHADLGLAVGTNVRRAPQHVTETAHDKAVYIECDGHACGSDGLLHRLKFTRKVERPDYLPFRHCACGDTLKAVVLDDTGAERTIDVVLMDTSAKYGNWPDSIIWVQLEEALEAGEAIKFVYCEEEQNEDSNELPFVLGANERLVEECTADGGDLQLLLASSLPAGDSLLITYYNSLGEVIGTVTVDEESANVARDLITVSADDPLTCNAEAEYTTLTAVSA